MNNEKQKLVDSLKKMCEFHEINATWDKGDNGYYESKRLLNSLSDDNINDLLETDLKVLEEIVFVKKRGKTESELGDILRMGGTVDPLKPNDLLFAKNNSFVWSKKYKRWFNFLETNINETEILRNILY